MFLYDKVSWCLSWRTGALTNTCIFIWTDSGPVGGTGASNYGERKHGILNLTLVSIILQRLSVTPLRVDWIDPKVIPSRSKATHLPPPIPPRCRIKPVWLLSRANISTHGMVHESVEPPLPLHDSIEALPPPKRRKREIIISTSIQAGGGAGKEKNILIIGYIVVTSSWIILTFIPIV